MVLKTRILVVMSLGALALARPSVAADVPRPQEVVLPVKDYLALVEKGEAAEKERRRREASREAPVAEITSQRVRVVLGDKDVAEVTAGYEVLVQGEPRGPVALPVTGVPQRAEVRLVGDKTAEGKTSGAALTVGTREGEWQLVAPAPGRYAVEISGPVLMSGGGVSRLTLAPAAAPVSLTEVELPADLAWSAPGTVVVEDRVEGARRTVRLTSRRGQAQTFEVRRKVDGEDAEKLLAQSVVLTLIQLRPDGPRRHDVVIYEVSRGGLGSFSVDLPPGLAVETVGTDEGEVVPAIESRRLTVQRRQQLRGVGYLVLSSTPSQGAELPLEPIVPDGTVRARYVALSSSVAAVVNPLPAASWSRVDLDDLPPTLREALGGVDLAAAWRLAGAPAGLKMSVSPLAPAASLPAVASLRDTTTLITLDGTLLHRDRITLRPAAIGTALDLTLPPGATLWSARVDDVAVRPLERGGGTISVPLGFDTGRDAVVEVVSVLARAIPRGRSQLALTLPRVALPVLEHQWRLLLPDDAQYRFRSGDLRPAVENEPVPPVEPVQPLAVPDSVGRTDTYDGQGGSSALYGTVSDDKHNALPGATVTLVAADHAPLVLVTNAQGMFRYRKMAPGTVTVKAELEGFNSLEDPNVQLNDGRNTTLELTLTIAVEDVITVTAESPMMPGAVWRSKDEAKRKETVAKQGYADEVKTLQQGLVGGVKPLQIAIPETGKLLLLSGVLPPETISVDLEVKGKK
ncbi:MAG TPA: carboxypeptidase-like regulatory domain-containing protein [Thermoanaerobaculia bacterium]|nr:carboxypeptidase-like regulatory domain-containing protein [Thermoanaerobaculia bacterium]